MEITGAFQGYQPIQATNTQRQDEQAKESAEKTSPPQKKTSAVFTPAAQETDKTAQTLFYVQKISSHIETESKESKGVELFREYMSKTPEERWREQILGDMGLTEEGLRELSAEDQQKIEEKIREIIEAKIQEGIEEGRKENAVEQATQKATGNTEKVDDINIRDIDVAQIDNINPNVAQLADLPQELQNLYEQAAEEKQGDEI
ncbi:MAG: hypothetical protein ACRBCK_04045 [Alphaproteobacteria bacterium]